VTTALRLVPDEDEPAARSAQLIQAHLEWLRIRGLRPATIKARRGALLRLQRRLPYPLIDAIADDLRLWQERLTLGPHALGTETAHVAEFYKWAARHGHRPDNPADLLPRVKVPPSLPRPISEGDLRMALACAPDRIRPWLVLAGWCGLRAREIALLERADIHDQDIPPTLFVRDGKGGKQRVVPLPASVVAELAGCRLPSRGPVFRRADGYPAAITPARVSKATSDYLHSIGIDATLHQFRHRYATVAYQATHDLLLVQTFMGHESPKTTAGYAKINPQAPEAFLAAFDNSLRKAP